MSVLLTPAERTAVIEHFLDHFQDRWLERLCRDADSLDTAEKAIRSRVHGGEWGGGNRLDYHGGAGWIFVSQWAGRKVDDRISFREAARYARRAATQLAMELA